MARKLATDTRVQNPETGEQLILKPDGGVPSWASELITNPNAWVEDETGETLAGEPAPGVAPDPDATVIPEPEPVAAREDEQPGGDAVTAPPAEEETEQQPPQEPDPDTDPADAAATYEAMTVAELKAEIALRNTDRTEADKLAADGVKADLVAELVADDAK